MSEPFSKHDFIVFDTETTGLTLPGVADLEKQPRIIELGAARVSKDGKRKAELSQLINPNAKIEEACANHQSGTNGDCVSRGALCGKKIATISGIDATTLLTKPTFKEYLPELRAFFDGAQGVICHNAPFDIALLTYDLMRIKCTDFPLPAQQICSAQEYTHLFGKRPKLIQLYEKVVGRPLEQKHRALDDVNALCEVLDHSGFWASVQE